VTQAVSGPDDKNGVCPPVYHAISLRRPPQFNNNPNGLRARCQPASTRCVVTVNEGQIIWIQGVRI
jgi:hypothetical protein